MPSLMAPIRAHPYLAAYGAAFLAIWVVTVATWTIRPATTPDIHPTAALLQYILVVAAATLAALRIRIEWAGSRPEATLGFFDYRWRISDNVSGHSFWIAVAIGIAAMVVNVVLLAALDVLVTGNVALGSYLSWIGAGIGAGTLLGMAGAILAAVAGILLRRLRR